MFAILLTVLPVFVLLATGYASVRAGWLKPQIGDHLSAFAVRLAIPALLFRAMVDLDFSAAFRPAMLLSFYAGALSAFVLGIALARLVWKRRPGEAVAVGFCAMFSNSLLMGIPIISRAWGDAVAAPAFGILSLHAPLLYSIGMATMEVSRRDGRPLRVALAAAARSILANPLMIGIIAGAAVNLSGLPLPEFLMAAISMLAGAGLPVALVALGIAFTRYSLRAELSESAMVATLSLVVHPAIVFAIAHWGLGLSPDHVRAAVVIAAMPPGMNGYIFALLYDRAVALSASAILVATTASIGTITVWLAILQYVLG